MVGVVLYYEYIIWFFLEIFEVIMLSKLSVHAKNGNFNYFKQKKKKKKTNKQTNMEIACSYDFQAKNNNIMVILHTKCKILNFRGRVHIITS